MTVTVNKSTNSLAHIQHHRAHSNTINHVELSYNGNNRTSSNERLCVGGGGCKEGWRMAVAKRAKEELATREAALRTHLMHQRDQQLQVSPTPPIYFLAFSVVIIAQSY